MLLAAEAPKITVKQPDTFIVSDLGVAFSNITTMVFLIAGLIVFAFLILGGIQWITSGGDKAKTEAARGRITAALVGLAIVAASWAIMKIIAYVFGVDIFNLTSAIKPLN